MALALFPDYIMAMCAMPRNRRWPQRGMTPADGGWENVRMPTRTRSNTTKKTPPRWRIRVIEIDDPALPRRDAGKPNLTVDVTSTDPSTWDTWAERRSVDGARRIVRHDLSSRRSHADRDEAKKAEVAA